MKNRTAPFWSQENRINWRLQGQYLDPETGLHYNLHRYFDPVLRGFTSPDPIGLAGGLELWNYPGDPHSFIDPLGLATKRTSTTRVRHYTKRKGSKGIEASGKIFAQDNNRVCLELANKKHLNQKKAEKGRKRQKKAEKG